MSRETQLLTNRHRHSSYVTILGYDHQSHWSKVNYQWTVPACLWHCQLLLVCLLTGGIRVSTGKDWDYKVQRLQLYPRYEVRMLCELMSVYWPRVTIRVLLVSDDQTQVIIILTPIRIFRQKISIFSLKAVWLCTISAMFDHDTLLCHLKTNIQTTNVHVRLWAGYVFVMLGSRHVWVIKP